MILRLIFALLLLSAGIESTYAKRVALVMGNSEYTSFIPLPNPVNDARLMEKSLREVGFEVTLVLNADQAKMKKAMLDFGRTLRKGVDASLFYYAGHGVQVNGENYLIPTTASIEDEDEIAIQAIDVNEFLRTMESAKSPFNIVVLDACRNNPLSGARGGGGGLAPVIAPRGSFIAYATAPGAIARDGDSSNSPYSAALAELLMIPSLKLEEVFKRTRERVLAATGEEQVPWESSSIVGDFFFSKGKQTKKLATKNNLQIDEQVDNSRKIFGQIKDFQCGDNCYLTITKGLGEEQSALCVAKACEPWNEAGEIPKKLIGQSVSVTIGSGKQIDGNGDVVGDFPSFTSVTLNQVD